MTVEQILLEKWRSLPPDKQQEVFDFVEFLSWRTSTSQHPISPEPKLDLGEKLKQIRTKIINSGAPLLTDEDIDREVAERRGGYQELE
ncbi:DUF2281 domain-containing protein [Scytonema millei]|uniref:DUF2281 domain-containing protein n=1 Tax=Scytonema millei VB511283 TaxID=1245923 RepID=A0A9X5E414_9CYAN|nr:DUF2281 domain-containing protein [Scytonema millei]NHC34762.1 DUF2281 domain-containing protein [Scytonema millei VB511283]